MPTYVKIDPAVASACLLTQEESPSYNRTRFHLTDDRSNPRESATESKLPLCGKGERVG